nr:immunoglobulin heavy chain junction region [Mus musculus]MBK4189280.1 immunoglobulin heavy chain junction region [Mus musculus]MBK4189281.1 immunoglobulin heavy chain junction region [Mus musculus]MBK4189282.1 immunoglobulin heavy chain junction region [Mus musculus]MBK4189291.1 immunoglobulin heavy chain junction region [Mus musculus]
CAISYAYYFDYW